MSRLFRSLLREQMQQDLAQRVRAALIVKVNPLSATPETRRMRALRLVFRIQNWWRRILKKRSAKQVVFAQRVFANGVTPITATIKPWRMIRNENNELLLCPFLLQPMKFRDAFVILFPESKSVVCVDMKALAEYCVSTLVFKCPVTNQELLSEQVRRLQQRIRERIKKPTSKLAAFIAQASPPPNISVVFDTYFRERKERRRNETDRQNVITGMERLLDQAMQRLVESVLVESELYTLAPPAPHAPFIVPPPPPLLDLSSTYVTVTIAAPDDPMDVIDVDEELPHSFIGVQEWIENDFEGIPHPPPPPINESDDEDSDDSDLSSDSDDDNEDYMIARRSHDFHDALDDYLNFHDHLMSRDPELAYINAARNYNTLYALYNNDLVVDTHPDGNTCIALAQLARWSGGRITGTKRGRG